MDRTAGRSLDPERTEEDAERQLVLAHLRTSSEASVADLAAATRLPWDVVFRHVHALARDGSVEVGEVDGRSWSFADVVPRAAETAGLSLRGQAAARILARLLDRPRSTVGGLARSLGLAPTTVRWHVRRLEKHALVTRSGPTIALRDGARDVVRQVLGARGFA